jgi:tetratricopeptide (TPR) repeat protein
MKKTITLFLTLIFTTVVAVAVQAQDVKGSEIKALAYLEKGELDMAKAEIDAFFANPKNEKKLAKGKPWVSRAKVYQALALSDDYSGDSDEALRETLKAYAKVKELEKENSMTYMEVFGPSLFGGAPLQDVLYGEMYNKGGDRFNNEDFEGALAIFEKILLIMPNDTNACNNIIIAAYNLDEPNYAKIKKYSQKLIELGFQQSGPYKYIATVDMVAADEQMENAQNAADSAAVMAKYKEIIAFVNQGREKYPDDKDMLQYLIQLYVKANMTDEAIASMEESVKAKPEKQLYYNLGVLYDRKNDLENSAANYSKAIELDPNFQDAIFNLGVLYFVRGNKKLVEAADFQDMYGRFTNEKGRELQREGRELFAQALPHFEKVQKFRPNDRQIFEILYRMYYELDNKKKANEIYKILESMPDSEGE